MIERALVISLIIVAIHTTMRDGMIFHKVGVAIGKFLDMVHMPVLAMPIYECLICMGGIWTIIIYPVLFGWSWDVVPTMMVVIGLNTLWSAVICKMFE